MVVEGSVVDFIKDIDNAVDVGAPLGVFNAARRMYAEVMYSFRIEGPGWLPLSKLTIKLKKKRGAPEPERILKEFDHMRKSIEVRDETQTTVKPLFGPKIGEVEIKSVKEIESVEQMLSAIKSGFTITEKEGRKIGTKVFTRSIRPTIDIFQSTNYEFSVGLFDDTAFSDRVRRGIVHEYGGFEKIEKDIQPIEEIVTGRIKARALKGEQEVEKFGKEVKTRKIGKKRAVSRVIRIPPRSFLRMPFDRIEEELFQIMGNTLNQVLEDVLL
jgi:hypothetical protein